MKQNTRSIFEGVDTSDVDAIFNSLEEIRQMIIDGYIEELLNIDLSEANEVFDKFFDDEIDKNALREKVEIAVQRMVKGGSTLQQAFGLSDEAMEALYFMGHAMFKQRNYPAARRVFDFLIKLNSFESKYFHAMAATDHRQKDFFSAVNNYTRACILSPINNPELHYHSADCYLRMDDMMSATLSLGYCIEACDDRNEIHRQIKARALTLRGALMEKMQKDELTRSQAQKNQQTARTAGKKFEKECENVH